MARWMRRPNARKRRNAVYNAAAFAGATALAVTELLAESGGGRGGRKGGGEAATEAGFAAVAPVGWLRVANALPNGKNAVCNGTVHNGTARNATTRNGTRHCIDVARWSSLGSLSKPGARDHKRAMFGEVGRKSRPLHAAREEHKAIHSAPHCTSADQRLRIARALLVAKGAQTISQAARTTSDQLPRRRASGPGHGNRIEHASVPPIARPAAMSAARCQHGGGSRQAAEIAACVGLNHPFFTRAPSRALGAWKPYYCTVGSCYS